MTTDLERGFELLGKGDADGLRRLVEEDPNVAEERDPAGVSLLMHALYRGRRDLAELIGARKKVLDIFEAAGLGKLERLTKCAGDAAAVNSFSSDGFTACTSPAISASPALPAC